MENNAQPAPVNQPVTPERKSSRGFLSSVLVVLALVLGMAGGYFAHGKIGLDKKSSNQEIANNDTEEQEQPSPTMPSPSIRPKELATYINGANVLYSIQYPTNLTLYSYSSGVSFYFDEYTGMGPGPLNTIQILTATEDYSSEFDALYSADKGADVGEAQHAVDVKITKLGNIKIGNFDAVEYIRDGTIPSTSGLGRGPIGYSHEIAIKLTNTQYIKLMNAGAQKKDEEAQEATFQKMLTSFKILSSF